MQFSLRIDDSLGSFFSLTLYYYYYYNYWIRKSNVQLKNKHEIINFKPTNNLSLFIYTYTLNEFSYCD